MGGGWKVGLVDLVRTEEWGLLRLVLLKGRVRGLGAPVWVYGVPGALPFRRTKEDGGPGRGTKLLVGRSRREEREGCVG